MNIKDKRNIFSSYTAMAQTTFRIAVFLIFAFFILGQFIFPDERDTLTTNCRIFETTWEQLLDDGSKIPADVPGKVSAKSGEPVTLTTTLPDEIITGECLCFRPTWQDVSVYIDGELRLEYNTQDSRPFGTNSAMRYLFVELKETDAGKELSYQFTSTSKYAGDMRPCYIGDRLSIWLYLMDDSWMHILTALFLFMMSFFCIIVCGILKIVYKKSLPLKHLAWTIFFCAFWMLSEMIFRQVLIKNVSILSCYTYWSLMLIPIPLLLFINEIQNDRYRKVYAIPIIYAILMLITGTLLQLFDIVQFVQQLPFIHAGLLLAMVCLIATITIDTVKRRISDYLFVGVGIYGLLLTAIIEMVFYYIGTNLSLGTMLAIGLLFLLVMAVIKTGQDLLRSEKKKQQAITARNAQAMFLANMSHEIRTPINAIIGMNEMILRENENETVNDYAHNIQNASNMLLGLINDVLDFSKIESGQLELVEDTYHLPTLIQDELLLLKARTAGKPISTQIDIDPRLPLELHGDELRIKQILTNLLSNAVKYTNEGSVTLKAFFKQADDENILLCFSVIDTGIGIREEDLSKLFDSFKRLELNKNRTIQGTGLGLNIAKQLVDLMNGTILVESEYGTGSTFTISIPQKIINRQPIVSLNDALKHRKKEPNVAENRFVAPDASILIVDDNSMNLSLMKGLLKRTKMQVTLAASGRQCIELTRQHPYDIIFMDHMMPELDGVETLHMLRTETDNPNQNTIVIALTANAIAGCREMYMEYGFNDYFAKPVQADKLDALLLEYLPETLVHKVCDSKDKSEKDVSSTPSFSPKSTPDVLEINHAMGLSYCLDSEDFYHEMLTEFGMQAKQNLTQLEQYFTVQDWSGYATIAHGLKSSSRSIGAVNFSNLSLQHELAGKEANTAFIIAEYKNYIQILNALIQKIENKEY